MPVPTSNLAEWQSFKRVNAGEIVEIVAAGCYVIEADGSVVLRIYPDEMTARYTPVVGDFWIVYADGYQALSPREAFVTGYVRAHPLDARIERARKSVIEAAYAWRTTHDPNDWRENRDVLSARVDDLSLLMREKHPDTDLSDQP